jgi:hypothetical protein
MRDGRRRIRAPYRKRGLIRSGDTNGTSEFLEVRRLNHNFGEIVRDAEPLRGLQRHALVDSMRGNKAAPIRPAPSPQREGRIETAASALPARARCRRRR